VAVLINYLVLFFCPILKRPIIKCFFITEIPQTVVLLFESDDLPSKEHDSHPPLEFAGRDY